jgi:predicted ATPase
MKCECTEIHTPRRIVLTGGPGAGKTAVLELIRQSFCEHVHVLPESASIVFGGGFPRLDDPEARRAGQRAIFHVQRELEAALGGAGAAVILCDRGTLDGAAYWPGPDTLWDAVGTTVDAELGRYAAVIHLRTPGSDGGYDHTNPLRIETAAQAAAIDARIAAAWAHHPRRYEVAPTTDFLTKAARAVEILRAEMPACCREHQIAALGARS